MRLTPSCDKMVISTINGYLIIIHDLCLDTLARDLNGFKPNMYRSGIKNPLWWHISYGNSYRMSHIELDKVIASER